MHKKKDNTIAKENTIAVEKTARYEEIYEESEDESVVIYINQNKRRENVLVKFMRWVLCYK